LPVLSDKQACNKGDAEGDNPPKIVFAPLEKCVGHSLKNVGPSQKTLHPTWCPKLVAGLVIRHSFL